MRALHYLTSNNLCLAMTAPTTTGEWLANFWPRSFYVQSAAATMAPAIRYRFLPEPLGIPAGADSAQPVYHNRALQVWKSATGFRLCCGDSTLWVDPTAGEAVGWLAPTFGACAIQDQRDFFLLSLLMLCHGQHCFGLHANGVSDTVGRGYLLVGNSGSGKTTAAMTCVRQGWRYVGDDVVLLRQRGQGVDAHALRRDFACTQTTIDHFFAQRSTTIPRMTQVAPTDGNPVKQVVTEATFHPAHLQTTMRPALLCFTTIVQQTQSQLHPLADAQALIGLAQQSAGIMTDRTLAQQQLALLKQLTGQTRCYALHLGQDLLTDPAVLTRLLQQEAHGG